MENNENCTERKDVTVVRNASNQDKHEKAKKWLGRLGWFVAGGATVIAAALLTGNSGNDGDSDEECDDE